MSNDKPDEYTVTSDRLVGHDRGDTVTADDVNASVESLVQGGHLKRKRATARKPKEGT